MEGNFRGSLKFSYLWFALERSYNLKKMATSFEVEAVIQGCHEYKIFGKLKLLINFTAKKRKWVNY